MTQICIAGHIPLYAQGIAHALRHGSAFDIAGIALDADTAVELAAEKKADVVLIDLAMPDGPRCIRGLKALDPPPTVIAIALPETKQDVITAAEAGVASYVGRGASIDELIATVKDALAGKVSVPPDIASVLFRRVSALSSARNQLDDNTNITRRELEIAELIDRGLSNKEIASLLGIELSTVKNHVHNLLDKMQVRRRGEAAARLRHRLTPRVPAPCSGQSDDHGTPSQQRQP